MNWFDAEIILPKRIRSDIQRKLGIDVIIDKQYESKGNQVIAGHCAGQVKSCTCLEESSVR